MLLLEFVNQRYIPSLIAHHRQTRPRWKGTDCCDFYPAGEPYRYKLRCLSSPPVALWPPRRCSAWPRSSWKCHRVQPRWSGWRQTRVSHWQPAAGCWAEVWGKLGRWWLKTGQQSFCIIQMFRQIMKHRVCVFVCLLDTSANIIVAIFLNVASVCVVLFYFKTAKK